MNTNSLIAMWKKSHRAFKLLVVVLVLFVIYRVFFRKVSMFETFGNPASCTYYYMTNCGHCKQFTPEWDKFVQNYRGDVKMRKVEMNEAGDDLEKYNIKGFPTVLIMDESGETKEYDGPRTADGLNKYFLNM